MSFSPKNFPNRKISNELIWLESESHNFMVCKIYHVFYLNFTVNLCATNKNTNTSTRIESDKMRNRFMFSQEFAEKKRLQTPVNRCGVGLFSFVSFVFAKMQCYLHIDFSLFSCFSFLQPLRKAEYCLSLKL